jgi:hypothetical protein
VLETVTPVVTVQNGRQKLVRRIPHTETLRNSLIKMASRMAILGHQPEDIQIEVLGYDIESTDVLLGGKFRRTFVDAQGVPGWQGKVLLACSAAARWLLETASMGPGLGAKTAFGFGSIRVREITP